MKDKKPKLETLKDFKINPKSWAKAMSTAGRKYNTDIDELRQLAIKWIKRDIEESVDDFLYDVRHKKYLEEEMKRGKEPMPNGKFCWCDPEQSCLIIEKGED